MNRIIQPGAGKPVKRISVDIDIQGQVVVSGAMKGPLGQTVSMSMFDVAVTLSGVVASTLLGIAGKIPIPTKPERIKPHEFVLGDAGDGTYCKLCGDPDRAPQHQKGAGDAESESTN